MGIPSNVLKGLKNIVSETVETGVKEAGKIGESIITGKELLGDIKPMSNENLAKAKAEDEKKKQEEIAKMKNIPGRNVEKEIEEVVDEKERKRKQEEEEFLQKIKRQREAEENERNQMVEEPGNAKREAKKRQFAPGPKKKAPDPSQMSATSEFKGKID
jgi:type I site-specific restriction-modification system R (restriction) subunit